MTENERPPDKKFEVPDPHILLFGLLAVVLVILSLCVLSQNAVEKDWIRETDAIKNGITGPCDDCSITAETGGRFGVEWVIRVRYASTGRVRISIFESPWKSTFIPNAMSKLYDSLEYGPVDRTFTVGGCGAVFVSVSSLLTKEGEWRELSPVVMCS